MNSQLPMRLFLGLLGFSVIGLALQTILGVQSSFIANAASGATLLTGCWALFTPKTYENAGNGWGLLQVAILGAGAELIGLYSGRIFGNYAYTGAWWPSIGLPGDHSFPLMLPLAWLLVAGAAHGICTKWVNPPFLVVLAGFLSAVIDMAMEPVMTGPLGYWHWIVTGPLPGGAPLSNFLGWWGVSTIASALLVRTHWREPLAAAKVLGGYTVLFSVIALTSAIRPVAVHGLKEPPHAVSKKT